MRSYQGYPPPPPPGYGCTTYPPPQPPSPSAPPPPAHPWAPPQYTGYQYPHPSVPVPVGYTYPPPPHRPPYQGYFAPHLPKPQPHYHHCQLDGYEYDNPDDCSSFIRGWYLPTILNFNQFAFTSFDSQFVFVLQSGCPLFLLCLGGMLWLINIT